MTFQPGDIVMSESGRVHWTFLEYREFKDASNDCVIQSQMTGRRMKYHSSLLRVWRPGD